MVLVNVLHSKWCAKIDSKAQGKIIITVENWHLRNAEWKILHFYYYSFCMYHLTRKEKGGEILGKKGFFGQYERRAKKCGFCGLVEVKQ